MPTLDPSAAVMAVAEVAEDKRFCGKCGTEVGRGRDGRAGRVSGFCSKCRQPYSFLPPLSRDDLVAGQYRIAGCLAYGGLGWIYLAQDEKVSNRWVVLKGLLNSGDHDAMVAALAERQFLAQVEHPNVVRIYNFVQQYDAGYIVMEYVGGKPLKEVLRERRQGGLALPGQLEEGVLPVEHAVAYILAILPAFSYLHRRGLVYNDFKPDNVMLQGDDVKLIDLGAVTRMDDTNAPIYGTDGYQAPEVARLGPSPASDLYSVARCLAVLVLDFRGYQSKHRYTLPDASEHPVLARYESLYRFLLKGTAENPDDRFQTAEEMSEQLLGVLREVVAKKEGVPRPTASTLFGGDLQALSAIAGGPSLADWRHLPAPRVNPADPAAALVVNVAALPDPADQVTQLRRALGQGLVPESAEAHLGQARALIWLGDGEQAEAHLEAVNRQDPWDWRVTWYRGLRLLSIGDAAAARQAFERIGFDLPGELAPKLGEAMAAELSGDLQRASQLYDTVSAADPNYTSGCFGLARVRMAMGDRAGAVEAYSRVPEESILHVAAQVAMARALIRRGAGTGPGPGLEDLLRAGHTVERLRLDRHLRSQLTAELLEAALEPVTMPHWRDPGVELLGRPLVEVEVRLGLERAYRDLARSAVGDEKVLLVDRANQHRPLTAV
jgi:serine/threonine-protein kinase PknG